MSLDIKNINKKIILYSMILGFVVSFFTGIFSRNAFSVILINSLVSAIVFGLVILLSNVIIMAFLPELLESVNEEDSDNDSQVDIVMPEESYTVNNYGDNESGAEEGSLGYTDNDSGGSMDGFREINMNNLSSLDSDVQETPMEMEQDDLDSDLPPSSLKKRDSNFSGHSPEIMAKAVKTVLKKE